ncbi:peptidyl-tRNA hydrolase [Mrakia frigida]|uniref:aminoacyl-tRNA hydrolase n=1 Tax=Mrakia frigida TaxID=29902 RepID=UPI003FCC02FB
MPPRLSPMAFTLVEPVVPPPLVKHLVCIGLGNIPYPSTKHSIGHLLVDSLSTDLNFNKFTMDKNLAGYTSEGFIPHPKLLGEHVKVTLVKPKQLMNLTGACVAKLLARYPLELDPSHPSFGSTVYYLIHDHLDYQEGKIQIRQGGTHGGHNGMRSCLNMLGAKRQAVVWQSRVGVGRPLCSTDADLRKGELERRRENVVDFVMSNISKVQFEACQPGGPSTNRLWDDIKWAAFEQPNEKKPKPRKAFDTI